MSHINRQVLTKLLSKTGLSKGRIYELISEKTAQTFLPRHLAALALAAELGINVSKQSYATNEERKLLREAAQSYGKNSFQIAKPENTLSPSRRQKIHAKKKTKKARKSNL